MSACAKILAEDISPVSIAFFRNLFGMVSIGGYLLIARKTDILKTTRPAAHALRSTVGTVGLIVTLWALSYLPLSQANIIFFSSVLYTPLLAMVFLGERVGRYRWAAIAVGFFGVIIASQPSGMAISFGVALAFAAAFLHACVNVILRALGKTEHPIATAFYFVTCGFLMTGFLLPFVDVLPPVDKIWLLVLAGATGTAFQIALSVAFKYADASVVSPLTYTSLLWAVMFDVVIWGYIPEIAILIGAALIIGSNLFLLYRQRKNRAILQAPDTL